MKKKGRLRDDEKHLVSPAKEDALKIIDTINKYGDVATEFLIRVLGYNFIEYVGEQKYIVTSSLIPEKDFEEYSNKYLKAPVKYFSFLRPLNEFQIAKIFSKHEKYHKVFKSCNVGSKGEEWKWCCNCAKCLFAYIILSPFLYKEKLLNIFGEDLFEKKELLDIFNQLTGNGDVKPFDCVGTFEEVNYAICKTIENIELNDEKLPYLLDYYKNNFQSVDTSIDITKRYNNENNLTDEQNEILRKEVL